MATRAVLCLSSLLAVSAYHLQIPAHARRTNAINMKTIPTKLKWVPFLNAADVSKGTVNSGFAYGLEVAIVCDNNGKLGAFSNKIPPFGQPTTFAEIGDGVIVDPVTKSQFSLSTGKPVGTWCPSPPFIGSTIFARLTSPAPITKFECRKNGNNIEVKVNVNAKAQFEQGYWRGILDAQGKTDGGYY